MTPRVRSIHNPIDTPSQRRSKSKQPFTALFTPSAYLSNCLYCQIHEHLPLPTCFPQISFPSRRRFGAPAWPCRRLTFASAGITWEVSHDLEVVGDLWAKSSGTQIDTRHGSTDVTVFFDRCAQVLFFCSQACWRKGLWNKDLLTLSVHAIPQCTSNHKAISERS